MTEMQRRIVEYLRSRAGRPVNGWELRDACGAATEKVIHVQIHRLRRQHGAHISSMRGPYGGYQLEAA